MGSSATYKLGDPNLNSFPIHIPERLHPLGNRFIRLRARDKIPIDKNWCKKGLSATNSELEKWLAKGGNYGILLGNGLVAIDADNKKLGDLVFERLPLTFTVETGRLPNPGLHFYYHCPDWDLGSKKLRKNGEHLGEVKAEGTQIVGPRCIHPTGGIYQVALDIPIETITKADLIRELGEYIESASAKVPQDEPRIERVERFDVEIDIRDLIPLPRGRYPGGERYGPHPVHGSDRTGRNFTVNPKDNVWYCHRCGSGGSGLELLAVMEGILKCHEVGRGSLRGEKFLQVLEIAKERGLLKENYKPLTSEQVAELKKEALVRMNPSEAKIRWNGYDVILAEAPYKLKKKEAKTGNICINLLWRGAWIHAFMPRQLAKNIQGGKAYFLVGKQRGDSINVRDVILVGGA